MDRSPKTVINKDLYFAILILGASSVISGSIFLIMGDGPLAVLGAVKLLIAIPLGAYTIKHKVGQKVGGEPTEATGPYDQYKSKSQFF